VPIRVDPVRNQSRWADPLTKKVEPKEVYCEPLNDTAVCGGVHKL
jgi:cytochrome c